MQTDKQRTKSFLDSLGILYGEDETTIAFGKQVGHKDQYPECDKVGGYTGFYTCFVFDEHGAFVSVGAWE